MTLYDHNGKPVAYTEDGTHIYLFSGEPVAYFVKEAVYGFNGKHLGWFDKGWMRDLKCECVFFSENTSGSGPVMPVRSICPIKRIKRVQPIKRVREIEHIRAIDRLSWSSLSGIQFFAQ